MFYTKEFDDTKGYDYYRELYIQNIMDQKFPWKPAYFYYLEHINRIDIMGFEEFQDVILEKNIELSRTSQEEAWESISAPMYDVLEQYYNPIQILSKDNKVLMIC